jgi:hypothetical protein
MLQLAKLLIDTSCSLTNSWTASEESVKTTSISVLIQHQQALWYHNNNNTSIFERLNDVFSTIIMEHQIDNQPSGRSPIIMISVSGACEQMPTNICQAVMEDSWLQEMVMDWVHAWARFIIWATALNLTMLETSLSQLVLLYNSGKYQGHELDRSAVVLRRWNLLWVFGLQCYNGKRISHLFTQPNPGISSLCTTWSIMWFGRYTAMEEGNKWEYGGGRLAILASINWNYKGGCSKLFKVAYCAAICSVILFLHNRAASNGNTALELAFGL